MSTMMDVFKGDAFSLESMVRGINKLDYTPGRIGDMNLFDEVPVSTTSVAIEEREGVLQLVQTSPRGAPSKTTHEKKRTMRNFAITHLEKSDTVYADSIQNVRAFGSGSDLEAVQAVISRRQAKIVRDLEATVENLRLGAIRGQILDADGSVIYNLFDEFGVSQLDEVNFALTTETTDVRKVCQGLRRAMAKEMGSLSQQRFRIHAFVGDNFFDALLAHKEVKMAYDRWQTGAALRDDFTFEVFSFAGIDFENYRGSDDGTSINIDPDKAHFFPKVQNLFETYYAPADYMETANTLGLPLYSKLIPDPEADKWIRIDCQSNPLPICLRPRVLMKGIKVA